MQARLVAKAKRKHPKEVDRLADSYAERDSRSARTQQAARAAARAEAQTALRALLEQQRQHEGETKDSDQDGLASDGEADDGCGPDAFDASDAGVMHQAPQPSASDSSESPPTTRAAWATEDDDVLEKRLERTGELVGVPDIGVGLQELLGFRCPTAAVTLVRAVASKPLFTTTSDRLRVKILAELRERPSAGWTTALSTALRTHGVALERFLRHVVEAEASE
jgi:hypothetical protein